MASSFSLYLGNKIVRYFAGNAMPTAPTDLYLSLWDGNPKSGGSEVTTSIHSAGRIAVVWDPPASGTVNSMSNGDPVDFGNSEAAEDITHVALHDASSAGNLFASKALSSPQSVLVGTPISFDAGDLTVTVGSST